MPQQVLEEILKHYPSEKDRHLIVRAFEFARLAHTGQKRFSGEEYIIHPMRAALILAHLKMDPQAIAAAILHDVIDDTKVTPAEMEKEFGKEISLLVKGVSSLGKLRLPKQNLEIEPIEKKGQRPLNLQTENLRRMFFAMAEDIRVIIIKLADRVHNMETLQYIPKEKQKRFALETMEIFAPLADRLGIKTIKTKLDNLAFPYLYPKEYEWLNERAKTKQVETRPYLDRARASLIKMLRKEGIEPLEVDGRLKAFFSLYRKLLRHDMDFDRIYDLAALRIIVKDVKECYETLGVIHQHWKPLPGRIKDYIAFPKPNGYQSLHSTVFCDQGRIIEVQIRTKEMDDNAEYGICAHWAEKEGVDLKRQERQFAWVQQLAGWQKERQTSQEFLDGLKIDFFKNRIFVFTPKGHIVDLPEGACAVDFAYAVHSEIGDRAVGAKANSKMIPLSASLKNGDIVEILTDKNRLPSRDWLKFVKTNLARAHIKKKTEGNFLSGLASLRERIFHSRAPAPEKETLTSAEKLTARPAVVLISGKKDVAYELAKCCRPQTGQEISAYLPRVKAAASIHLQNCQNLKRLRGKFPEKVLEAKWQ